MVKAKLTKRTVEAISPAGADALIWDTEIPGFGVKVTPRGARIYVLQYSRRDRTRRCTIGRHGDLTAEQARREAQVFRGIIAKGGDPARDRARQRAIPIMQALAERYMTEHAMPHKKASSAREDRRLIDCHILPLLGAHKVSDISRGDIRRFIQDVAAGKTRHDQKTVERGRRIVSGGRVPANRCLTLLSKMFGLAEDWGYRPDGSNPCRMVERFAEAKRERFLSTEELRRLGDALAALEAANSHQRMPAIIIRLLLLTGARSSEIVGLRSEYVDLGRGLIRLPDSKTGAKVIVLPAPARQILAKLMHERQGKGYLFPSRRAVKRTETQPYAGLKGFWNAVRKAAELGDTRIHDLRHTHASVGVASGFSLLMVGKLLGHAQTSTTERYAHLADDPVRQAADFVGNRIAEALAGRPE